MNFNEYQEATNQTAVYPKEKALEYLSLGLASEAGEVAGKIKKIIRDENGQLTENSINSLISELGDVLWYLAQLANLTQTNLEEIATANINKLESRHVRNALHGSGDNR